MSSEDQKIGTISTFVQRLEKLGREDGKFVFFRGHSNRAFELKPLIYRNRGWIRNEATMMKEVILRCPDEFVGRPTTFQCLVRMQHYGLPTRLLDITANPLVALYFACADHEEGDRDGEVIVFDFGVDDVKYFDSDTVSVLANLSRRPAGFVVPPPASQPDLFNDDVEIRRLLHDVRQDRPEFRPELRRADLGRVICVKPLQEHRRIVRQDGAFLLFGCDGEKVLPAELPGSSIRARVTINAQSKTALLTQLERLGVSKATMFPEIDQVAAYVKDVMFVPELDIATLPHSQQAIWQMLNDQGPGSTEGLSAMVGLSRRVVSKGLSELLRGRFVEPVGAGRSRRWRVAEGIEVRGK